MAARCLCLTSRSVSRLLRQNHVKYASLSQRNHSTASSVDNFDKQTDYDIIIAGGGMVGCTLACALAKNTKLSSQKILLLEGSPEKKYALQEQYSNRVSALNPSTKNLMKTIGVWKHVENMRLQPVKNMQVWDGCSDAMITFNRDSIESDVAYIVENDVLQHAVNTELTSLDIANPVKVVYSSKIASYDLPTDVNGKEHSVVKMENGDTYSCKLLIGADGANSKVRKSMGVQYVSWNYDQMGVVATLQLSESTENTTAWQRFLPKGTVAILPLTHDLSSLVWSTAPAEARSLISMPEEQFVDALNQALFKQLPHNWAVDSAMGVLSSVIGGLGGVKSASSYQLPPSIQGVAPSSRAGFPLGFGHSVNYVSKGVALIGDAAHRVHPLAGQGVNLGFGDVNTLVQLLADAVYSGNFIGDKRHLARYESQRQRHVVPTSAAIDALQRIYSTEIPPLVLLRSLGLQITNAVTPLKKAIMNHAMT